MTAARVGSNIEALLREVIANQASLSEQVTGHGRAIDAVQKDAREARDAARDLAASQLPAKLAEMKGLVEKLDSERRSDLINSISIVTRELREVRDDHGGRLDAHDKRFEEMDLARARLSGATGLVGWVSKHAPWLIPTLIALGALVGLKTHDT